MKIGEMSSASQSNGGGDKEPAHAHGLCQDAECKECRTSLNTVGKAAIDQVRAILGVNEAIAFAKTMSERGKDYGWNQVPDVAAAIDQHLMDTRQVEPERFLDALGIAVKRVSQKVE